MCVCVFVTKKPSSKALLFKIERERQIETKKEERKKELEERKKTKIGESAFW